MPTETLEQTLARYTREGELYEKLPDKTLRCLACGHRCLIREGKRGVCLVRFNEGGVLKVPFGYVGALQCDPVEKKPFFHVLPGTDALSFGMLGCDFHCSYCTPKNTYVMTERGPQQIGNIFDSAQVVTQNNGSTIATVAGLRVYTHTGQLRRITKVFCHPYHGLVLAIKPRYLPAIEVTPEHEFLAARVNDHRGEKFIRLWKTASQLTSDDYLVIPKGFSFSQATTYDTAVLLKDMVRPFKQKRVLRKDFLERVLALSGRGISSKEIGRLLGKSGSHIRHLRSKVRKGVWNLDQLQERPGRLLIEQDRVRFTKEHAPGAPRYLPLDERLARILGYYAAEGCVLRSRKRVLTAEVVFALGHHEGALAREICRLVKQVFGVEARIEKRSTTIGVTVSKASIALLIEKLCHTGARRKRIPPELFSASRPVVEAFLESYLEGDGHLRDSGQWNAATVSEELAFGLTWLALKTGRFPSLQRTLQKREGIILGRKVRLAPQLFHLSWFSNGNAKRMWLREDESHFYVPIHQIAKRPFNGHVYNLEVENEHSYLAQFVSTHNCQNFITSQALRDPTAGAPPQLTNPEQLVCTAKELGAAMVASTYNEPLITSEWAVDVFKVAKAQGFKTAYISNGNGTEEVLQYIRPWVDCYKIDLKSFNPQHYRVELGGQMETVKWTIRRVKELGFWLEIVTLIIPGFNDSEQELTQIAQFLVGVSPDIPWHVTAFHQDYKMTEPDNTKPSTLMRAAEIGQRAGVRYVYAGNLPGLVGPYEHTRCPSCRTPVIERQGYTILANRLIQGRCPSCRTVIPGCWS